MSGKIGKFNFMLAHHDARTTLLVKAGVTLLVSVFFAVVIQHHVGALAYYGPEDGRARYALEYSSTTQATSLTVPIYYRTNPGTVTVNANSFLRNSSRTVDVRVSFNGGPQVSSDTSFNVGGFVYDPSSGWYRSQITATMQNYSGQNWRNYIHFRLDLSNTSGYIGYGGGVFQQASTSYYNSSPASNYSLYLATPCTVTSNQARTVSFYDLDNRNADNGSYHLTLNIYDETTGQLIASRDGDRDAGMGQGGTLNVPITFTPLHKYRVDIIGVSPNNVIQYNFPYDNIAYSVGCQWGLSGSSTVNGSGGTITVVPGATLNWVHRLTNNGPHVTDENVFSNIGISGISETGWSTGVNGLLQGSGQGVGVIRTIPSSAGNYTRLVVNQDDVGNTLCEWIQYDPINSDGARNGRSSPQACASVPYNYSLIPSLTIDQDEVEVGGSITAQPSVRNAGPTRSKPTEWQLSYITIPPSGGIPAPASNSAAPCTHFLGAGRTCTVATFTSGGAATGIGLLVDPPSRAFTARGAVAADLPVGTQICYALSVRDRAHNSSQWAHSAPDCVVVSKRPVVRVTGSDLIVGRGLAVGSVVSTNVKTLGGTRYGAWSEYGIVASGLITGMASASGYAGGSTATTLCGVSYLSFSNKVGTSACSDARVGQYTFKAAASTIAGRFPTTTATPIAGDQLIRNLTDGRTYTNNSAGAEIRLTGNPATRINAGELLVINAPGATVKIMNNIIYTDGVMTSISQLPQVVIIARNIVIADTVTQVDAWLVAIGTGLDGRVNTCGAAGPPGTSGVTEVSTITSTVCGNMLTVNGPVIANHLFLRRTAGAGTGAASGNPAEVFNLRPDAYMWASNLQSGTTKAQTVMTTELPPRY